MDRNMMIKGAAPSSSECVIELNETEFGKVHKTVVDFTAASLRFNFEKYEASANYQVYYEAALRTGATDCDRDRSFMAGIWFTEEEYDYIKKDPDRLNSCGRNSSGAAMTVSRRLSRLMPSVLP
ncbi:uncharacterized protein E0L32_007917 [Thyridium curvatum]|uniref:Uncharacterized protein n=1 Tax=Thyridium curvatum TaxID=1093900 RepID=A0A507AWD6_9PEZI|nr:uncharacterized protein E0L32_007917 [Thyridium curvatum]TPX11056.1 hypothetical protein E0L32_007917 [Thyridium curvatum]